MANTPAVSVIMLTYNREAFVPRAVESVLNQTFSDFEYIIIDNGSVDRSGAIAEEYAARDSRVRVIRRERGNIGGGRNAGLDAARGGFIAFIDDDDFCEPDFLEFLYNLAAENNADVSICGAAGRAFDEKKIMTAEEAVMTLLWRERYNVAFPAKMFKSTLFDNARFSDESKYDDIELMPKILGGANRVAYHGLPKYTFVRHGNNNSAWTTNHSLLDAETLAEYLAAYHSRVDWLSAKFPNGAPAWRYFEWSFMISMVEKIDRLKIKDCQELYEKMLGELRKNREEFLNCGFIQDFEKKLAGRYL